MFRVDETILPGCCRREEGKQKGVREGTDSAGGMGVWERKEESVLDKEGDM